MNSELAQKAAREIADHYRKCACEEHVAKVAALIDSALQEQREAYAKIAETSPPQPAHTYASENAEQYRVFDAGQRFGAQLIAAAIRKGE